jgi:hypothetical protein
MVIPTMRDNSPQSFFRDYYCQSQPVLLNYALGWESEGVKWSFASIRERFGDIVVNIHSGRAKNGKKPTVQPVRLRDFIEELQICGPFGPYLTPAGGATDGPLLSILNGFEPLPGILASRWTSTNAVFWMAPRGASTRLHADWTNVMVIPLIGARRIILIPPKEGALVCHGEGSARTVVDPIRPDPERFPLFREATPREAIVAPGQALFIPVSWWHYLESIEPTLSLTAGEFLLSNPLNEIGQNH